MSAQKLPTILCVDDEPRILDGLVLNLRKDFSVHIAVGGDEALKALRELEDVAVVISDMRMPGMDGATLLRHVMKTYPDATRILLTGEPGRDAAANAVNQAQIFRFLAKPCPPDQLKAAIEAGVIQHRMVRSERAVLMETLIGCIKALIDVLAIANPVAFGRADRVKRLAISFADSIDCRGFWQLDAAAMLSQVGYLSLPAELVEKIHDGMPLTPEEKFLAKGVPDVAVNLLQHIPRLDPVIQILTALSWTDEQIARLGDGTIGTGTRVLGLALEYDALIRQGHAVDVAVQTLRSKRESRFGSNLIDQFARYLGAGPGKAEVREVQLKHVKPGMIILQDIRTHLGTLLVPRDFEVTSLFIDKSRSFGPELLNEQIKVLIPVARVAGD